MHLERECSPLPRWWMSSLSGEVGPGEEGLPGGAKWAGLRARLRSLVAGKAGGEESLERECFSMARGDEGCRLVKMKA